MTKIITKKGQKVSMGNPLIESIYPLKMPEQRLFLYALSLLNMEYIDDRYTPVWDGYGSVVIDMEEFMKCCELKIQRNQISMIQKAYISMARYYISIKKDDYFEYADRFYRSRDETPFRDVHGDIKFPLFIAEGTLIGKVRGSKFVVMFNPLLRPFISELSKNFTTFELKEMLNLGSKTSMNLYRMMLMKSTHALRKKFSVSIDELKEIVGCDKEKTYENLSRFKDCWLRRPMMNINECTKYELSVKLDEKDENRVVFHVKKKKSKDVKPPRPKMLKKPKCIGSFKDPKSCDTRFGNWCETNMQLLKMYENSLKAFYENKGVVMDDVLSKADRERMNNYMNVLGLNNTPGMQHA